MYTNGLFHAVGGKERLVDRVVSEIERSIVAGTLAPETKLPPERELAEQLGVSRTVLREAVRMLVTKGLLEAKHGYGTTVRQVTGAQLSQPLNLLLRTNHTNITFAHLYQVRTILEVEIAAIAARQATPEDIIQLAAVMQAMLAAPDGLTLAARDADFHRTLAPITHNPLLIILLDSFGDVLQEYILRIAPHLDPARQVLPFHQAIVERIAAKDEEGAREAMRAHFRNDQNNRRLVFGEGEQ